MKAGEKVGHLKNAPSHLITPLDTSDNMKKEGYEIKNDQERWKMDHWIKNYDLKDMALHSVEALPI